MNSIPSVLQGEVNAVSDLSGADRDRMLALMQSYFQRVTARRFQRDLDEKQWVVVLRDVEGCLQGFSTIDLMQIMVGGRMARAVYSGDTIADRAYWRTAALPRAFLRFVSRHTSIDQDGVDWYWFYVCKGYRTYRFLPVFYRRFYPHPAQETPPFEQAVLSGLAQARFGSAYDPRTGIVTFPGDYLLRRGVGDITPERRKDPFVSFFADRNPGWQQGDELACLAPLSRHNLRNRPARWLNEEAGW